MRGNPIKAGLIGCGDEGNVLVTDHDPEYVKIVAVSDIRPSNQQRIFRGDGFGGHARHVVRSPRTSGSPEPRCHLATE